MGRTVEVTELVLRDGHQSLLATRMAMEDMVPVCEDIDHKRLNYAGAGVEALSYPSRECLMFQSG